METGPVIKMTEYRHLSRFYKVFGNLVSWASRTQSTVSLSSTEAEYVSLCKSVSEAIWLQHDVDMKYNFIREADVKNIAKI